MGRGLLQRIQIVRCPSEQMAAQKVVHQLGPLNGQKRQQGQHEPDVVLGRALVGGALDAAGAHPSAQGERDLAEDDAFAIGVHRPPRRRGQMPRPHEQAMVLPYQLLVLSTIWRAALSLGTLGFCTGVMRSLAIGDPSVGTFVNALSMGAMLATAVALLAVWAGKSLRINVGHIAELLFVSENTVRTHSKRIYVKLDVHKHQELIDLVERFEPEGR